MTGLVRVRLSFEWPLFSIAFSIHLLHKVDTLASPEDVSASTLECSACSVHTAPSLGGFANVTSLHVPAVSLQPSAVQTQV